MVKWHEGIRDYRGLRLCHDCWDNRHYRWLKDKDSKSKGKGKKVSACTGCECPCKELLIQQSAPNPRIKPDYSNQQVMFLRLEIVESD